MEIFASSSGSRPWLSPGRPISAPSRCKCKGGSLAVPRMGSPKPVRTAPASENGTEKGLGVLEMISSGVGNKPWWAPLFSFNSSNPNSPPTTSPSPSNNSKTPEAAGGGGGGGGGVGKKSKVVFTEEKARLLRRKLRATECWEYHGMYHSPVASRLALTFSEHDSS